MSTVERVRWVSTDGIGMGRRKASGVARITHFKKELFYFDFI
jgi:hypothetical protein